MIKWILLSNLRRMAAEVPMRTLADLDFGRVLERVAHHTRTVPGEALARRAALYRDADRVRREIAATSQMRALLDGGNVPPFGGLSDVRPILDHAAKHGVLEPEDLLRVADTLRGVWLLRRFLQSRAEDSPLLSALGECLPDMDGVHDQLYDAFDERGVLADDASDELKSLRGKRRSLHERIRKRIRSMLNERGVEEHLMDTYYTVREDRYVLPVRSGEKAQVDGIIHGSSNSGATLFIEPAELVSVNNELKLCEQAVAREEHRILAELTRLVGEHRGEVEEALDAVAEIDVLYGRARLADELQAHAPQINEKGDVHLAAARNPLLVLRGVPVVANDIDLGGPLQMLVVTGPNAGGKTVTLSTLGLCALMARAGMHIPAGPDSTLPAFTQVLTLMGDNQDLQADLSTFTGHLERLQTVLDAVTEGALVLLDELAVGTAPGQGAALAIAVLESLADRGAVGAVTTHYERLKTLSLEDQRFSNAAVALNKKTSEPDYRLRMGMPGSSSGLEVALKVGLDKRIVDRASEIFGDPDQNMERVLRRLDEEREALAAERAQAETLTAELQRQNDELAARKRQMEEQAEALVRAERAEALNELDAAREVVRQVVRDLQRDPDAKAVQKRRKKLSEVEARLRGEADGKQDDGRPALLSADEAVVGAKVFIEAFNRDGTITAVKGNKAEVAVGSIRTKVRVADLRRAKEAPQVKRAPKRQSISVGEKERPVRSTDNTCDVRGMRLDEAVEKVERFLDNAMLLNRSAGYILHGHGTGRLKAGLRERFKASPYVSRFEVAHAEQGGDAVTLVWLK